MKFNINKSKKSQAGFSLVELMIVVSIIGILSSIAVPQFQKFIFKARQTEAKTGLTGLYTAEKAFFGEYGDYDSRFGKVGYAPEGKYYYNIGFKSTVKSQISPADSGSNNSNTLVECPLDNSNPKCQSFVNAVSFKGSYDVVASAPAATPPTASTFKAGAESSGINPDNKLDAWSIDDTKNLVQQ